MSYSDLQEPSSTGLQLHGKPRTLLLNFTEPVSCSPMLTWSWSFHPSLPRAFPCSAHSPWTLFPSFPTWIHFIINESVGGVSPRLSHLPSLSLSASHSSVLRTLNMFSHRARLWLACFLCLLSLGWQWSDPYWETVHFWFEDTFPDRDQRRNLRWSLPGTHVALCLGTHDSPPQVFITEGAKWGARAWPRTTWIQVNWTPKPLFSA